ncbi:nuclear transport factor 2 family protein [Sphingomonas solaris]|uniref:Nuclear transport factor 2 family protein n=1 Tax=Alterirhizorhabdus solaris TaxID=2529389 RepID=A0A558RB37_9SPHN|nr:nuclear transport factor 2 family protein [Sphingomonas solaris]TVV76637.1 nuclear transport factor 2 family protein [Sphingomonas solaris]
MGDDTSSAVMAAEKARCAAMLANDAAALDALLDPRLSFSHATGQVDDKAAYCTKMAAGRIDYLSIDWSEDRVIVLGDGAALLTGRMTSSVRVEGVEKRLDNRVLAGWAETDGAWRLVAFQSTPLKG